MSSKSLPTVAVTVLVAACGGGAIVLAAAPHSTTTAQTAPAQKVRVADVSAPTAAPAADAKGVYERTKDSVAEIQAAGPQGQGTGTGFVVSADGLIVTNGHVVEGAEQIGVKLGTSDTVVPAQVVGGDPNQDLAILQIDTGGQQLTPLPLSQTAPGVGETVYALGNPFGLSQTFTSGIVSAVGRDIQAPDGATISNVIQTDAAINPGNSGGPLLNSAGEVVGVNSQIFSQGGGNDGIGFAIPAATVQQLLDGSPA